MKFIFSFLKSTLFQNKIRILVSFFCFFIFLVFLFPYSELTGFITSKVSKATRKKWLVQIEDINPFIFPGLGVSLVGVDVKERKMSSSVQLSQARAYLSLLDLLLFKLSYYVEAQGLLGGHAKLSIRKGKSAKGGERGKVIKRKAIKLFIKDINLEQAVSPFFSFVPKGQVETQLETVLDTHFSYPPEGKAEIRVKDFDFPPSSFQTPFGPMNFPGIQLSSSVVQLQMKDGTLTLDNVRLGLEDDPFFVHCLGSLELEISRRGRRIQPIVGKYQVKVNLHLASTLQSELSLFLSALSRYKKKDKKGKTNYRFQMKGRGQKAIPKLSAWK